MAAAAAGGRREAGMNRTTTMDVSSGLPHYRVAAPDACRIWPGAGRSIRQQQGRRLACWAVANSCSAQPLPASGDYRTLADEGYSRNAIIHACIKELVTSFCDAPLVIKDGAGEIVQSGPLFDLLTDPNPEQSEVELRAELALHRLIMGESFLHMVPPRSGRGVAQLWALRPDRVRVCPGSDGLVSGSSDPNAGYKYIVDGASDAPLIPWQQVIHVRETDPLNDYRGLSPVLVAARMGDLDNNSVDFMRAIFKHGYPGGVLKFKRRVQPEDRRRAKVAWDEAHSGPNGWRSTSVLDDDVDWTKIGFDPKEADMSSVFGVSETRICMVFGVPPIVIGARIGLEFATYANYAAARRSFWEETMLPWYKLNATALNRGLRRHDAFAGYSIAYDFAQVVALQDDPSARSNKLVAEFKAGLITKNEARAALGHPRDVNGDYYETALGVIGEPAAIEEMQARPRSPRLEAA